VFTSVPAQLSGWGAFTQRPPWTSKEHLQYKNTTIMTNTECTWRTALAGFFEPEYRPVIYSGHICTLAERGIGGCFGGWFKKKLKNNSSKAHKLIIKIYLFL
jgi:hypothetical protein